jgi:hypothetical protein
MGRPSRVRFIAPRFILGAVLLFAFPATAGAQLIPDEEQPKAELSTTGNHSEIIKAIPISKKPAKRERVAMSLGPEQLKRISAGDRIRVSGEVQMSTTCVAPGPRCVGTSYRRNPTLTARIVLAPSAQVDAPAFGLSPTVKKRCKQQRPNRNHHCTLVIPNNETTIGSLADLPCPANACYVNLIVGAHNKRAKPTDRVVLGADRPDGSVTQDKGRLNVVQAAADVAAPAVSSTDALVNGTVPTTEGKKTKRRVAYSVPIPAPRKGEVLAFDSSFVADITGLRFNTFISTRVIVAETPTSTEPTGVAKSSSLLKGDATEANGFNCTLGRSGYANPCTVTKAGATRITRDVADQYGGAGILYLNVVVAAKPLNEERLKGPTLISLRPAGGLRVLRYSP